jgi:hypothetical protein
MIKIQDYEEIRIWFIANPDIFIMTEDFFVFLGKHGMIVRTDSSSRFFPSLAHPDASQGDIFNILVELIEDLSGRTPVISKSKHVRGPMYHAKLSRPLIDDSMFSRIMT